MDDVATGVLRAEDLGSEMQTILARVEHGEAVVITRGGAPVARIAAAATAVNRQAALQAMREIDALRETIRARGGAPFTREDILSARHDGHRL